jgi:CheY-like chemotaxis protein
VVICDIGLPDLDGYTLVRRLREIPALRATRFVALTGYGQEEDVRRAHDAGFAVHLTKPVEPERLRQVLAEVAVEAGKE